MRNTSDWRRICTWSLIPARSWWVMGFLESQAFSNCSVSFSVSCRGALSFWRDTHVFRPCDGVADSRRLCWRPFRDCRAAGEPSVLLIQCHLPTHPSQSGGYSLWSILILWSLEKLPSAGLAPHKWEMLGNGRTVHGPQQRSPDVWSLSWGWGRGQGAWRGYGHGDLFRSPAEKDAPRGQSPRAVPPMLSPVLSPWNKIIDSSTPRVLGRVPAGFFWSPCIQVRCRTHLRLPLFSFKVEVLRGLVPSTDTPVFTQSLQVILPVLIVSLPSGW